MRASPHSNWASGPQRVQEVYHTWNTTQPIAREMKRAAGSSHSDWDPQRVNYAKNVATPINGMLAQPNPGEDLEVCRCVVIDSNKNI